MAWCDATVHVYSVTVIVRFGFLSALISAALLSGCSTAAGPTRAEVSTSREDWTATGDVGRVVDGDTFDLRTRDRGVVRIRFAGIDAPERGQAYSRVATEHLKLMLGQGPVTVRCSKIDEHKRAICNVWAAELDVGLELIRAGLAWHFKRFQHEQDPETRLSYADAEEQAKERRRGLWSFTQPMAPWDCRRSKREGAACR